MKLPSFLSRSKRPKKSTTAAGGRPEGVTDEFERLRRQLSRNGEPRRGQAPDDAASGRRRGALPSEALVLRASADEHPWNDEHGRNAPAQVPVELDLGIGPATLKFLDPAVARSNNVIPYKYEELTKTLYLATDHAVSLTKRQNLYLLLTSADVRELSFTQPIESRRFAHYRDRYYPPFESASRTRPVDLVSAYGFAPGVTVERREITARLKGDPEDFVDYCIFTTKRNRGTDVMFDIESGDSHITCTIDGRGYAFAPPIEGTGLCEQSVRILKRFCGLDQAPIFAPLSGSYEATVVIDGQELSLIMRCEFQPTPYGEVVSVRIQDGAESPLKLDTLGLDALTLAQYKDIPMRPDGLHLWCGRVGEGKTSSMRAVAEADIEGRRQRKWFSIQDPIEFTMPGMRALQVSYTGMSWEAGLRSILRANKPKGVVGEMRDAEVGRMAKEAASTGHSILSTVHALDATDVLRRLTGDLHFTWNDLAMTLRNVFAQVLMPTLCTECKVPMEPERDYTDNELLLLGFSSELAMSATLFRPNAEGCSNCLAGYRGRRPIFETFCMTPLIRELLYHPTDTLLRDVRLASIEAGLRPLRWSAIGLAHGGDIYIGDVARKTSWSPSDGRAAVNTHRMLAAFRGRAAGTYENMSRELEQIQLAAAREVPQLGAAPSRALPPADPSDGAPGDPSEDGTDVGGFVLSVDDENADDSCPPTSTAPAAAVASPPDDGWFATYDSDE